MASKEYILNIFGKAEYITKLKYQLTRDISCSEGKGKNVYKASAVMFS
jgi:hypothetical protein